MLTATVTVSVDTSTGEFDLDDIVNTYVAAGYEVAGNSFDEDSNVVELKFSRENEANIDLYEVFNLYDWDEDLMMLVSYLPGLTALSTMTSYDFMEMCEAQSVFEWEDVKLSLYDPEAL